MTVFGHDEATEETDGRRLRRIEGRALLLDAAMRSYDAGEPIDLNSLAATHGVGRSSAYRWFGNNDELLAELMLLRQKETFEEASRQHARKRGRSRVVNVLLEFMRHVASSERFLTLLLRDPARILRIVTSSRYSNQDALISQVRVVLDKEAERGMKLPMDSATLAYALVKLSEGFIYTAAVAGQKFDVERAREVFTKLLDAGAG